LSHSNFENLLTNYLSDSLSEAELKEFLILASQPEYQHRLQRSLDESLSNRSFASLADPVKADIIFENILRAIKPDKTSPAVIVTLNSGFAEESTDNLQKKRMYWWRYAAAAVLFILFSAAAYFIFFNHKVKQDMATTGPGEKRFTNDVAPGTEKAILTLADGTTIVLDSLSNGAIAQQGNTVIMKEDGLLAYNADTKNLPTGILYNTITIPRGGEYRSLVLADGTKVWLNAESSIRFPTAFIKNERVVEITGEAYFEVAKNPSHPFRVFVAPPLGGGGGMKVEVLGTHFNVNAYSDEAAIKTTLIEGLVKIVNNEKASFLKPGQQAILRLVQDKKEEIKIVDDADIEEALAWKNGLFRFQKADIKTIMRQVSRWYDVEVEYEKEVTETFSGTIPRNVTVSKLFTMLELTGHVHFKIDGKKIAVIP